MRLVLWSATVLGIVAACVFGSFELFACALVPGVIAEVDDDRLNALLGG